MRVRVSEIYRDLPRFTESYRELPGATESYRELPRATESLRCRYIVKSPLCPRDNGRWRGPHVLHLPGDSRQRRCQIGLHIFHHDCISNSIVKGTREQDGARSRCPNCRAPVVSMRALDKNGVRGREIPVPEMAAAVAEAERDGTGMGHFGPRVHSRAWIVTA